MAGDTKGRILETALELFAQNGYLGTSMNDIAERLGFTKAALYKHYTGKQEILDKIVERMNEMDYERAESYEMPETEPPCSWRWNSMGQCTYSTASTTVHRIKIPLPLCWMRILSSSLPRSNPVAGRTEKRYEGT